MPRIAFLALLALAACGADASDQSAAVPNPSGWRLASGKSPTRAELAAVVASCQDMTKSGPIDHCLSDLGLRHAP
jgi:hypothetical protein